MTGEGARPIGTRIAQKLTDALAPTDLVVIDESHHHAGHGHHHHPDGETHFRVEIVSPAFAGRSRVERHRMVNALLAEELSGRVHALAITARAPEEGK
jgi:BolA protein